MAPPSDAVMVAPLRPARRPRAGAGRDPAALQPNIGAMLHDVARLIRRRFERRARQTGLPITRQQARALLYIARNEGLSQAAVAAMLDIEPIALCACSTGCTRKASSSAARTRPTGGSARCGSPPERGRSSSRSRDQPGDPPGSLYRPAVGDAERLIEALGQVKENLAFHEETAGDPPDAGAEGAAADPAVREGAARPSGHALPVFGEFAQLARFEIGDRPQRHAAGSSARHCSPGAPPSAAGVGARRRGQT